MNTYLYREEERDLYSKIYDILIEEAHAREDDRESFILAYTCINYPATEYRFCGSLGFGGKFWRYDSGQPCPYYISCYPEERTADNIQTIDKTNARLKQFYLESKVQK